MTMATTSPWLAVAAGMLTVGAPCVLPMLPVVLGASVSGADSAQRTRPLFIALGFALSFAAVALLFSSFTQVLGVSQEGLRRFAAVMLLVFGVLTVWPRPFQWLSQHAGGVLNRLASLGMGCGGAGGARCIRQARGRQCSGHRRQESAALGKAWGRGVQCHGESSLQSGGESPLTGRPSPRDKTA